MQSGRDHMRNKDSSINDIDESKTVQSVERALSIIEALADKGQPTGLGEIAEMVDLSPSTAHRLLNTLMVRGFVDQDSDSRYRLGIKLFRIGNAASYALDIKEIAAPFMRQLLEQYNETVNMAILDNNQVVYIDQLESNNIVVVKMFAKTGSRGPAHCTGSGKVLLAGLKGEEVDRFLKTVELTRFTPDTIIDPEMMARELERVRRDGYALDMGERDEGVRCVAAPVKNHEGRVVAALSISGPSMRMTASYINNELTQVVKETAAQISAKMGYLGD